MDRPHCAVFIAASLDGYIALSDGSVAWLDAVRLDGEDYGFDAFFASVDTLLMGRLTWESVLGFDGWPYAGKRVAVLTHRPAQGRHGETFLAGSPVEVLARLHAEGARRVYVDGGQVISSFLREGLIDELTISIVPLVLGRGIRLFQGELPRRALRLSAHRSWPSGLVQLRYVPLAPPAALRPKPKPRQRRGRR